MLQIIIAILYITFICFSWGQLGLQLVNKGSGESFRPALPVCSLFGLALIGIVSQVLSIFIPMGGWQVQVLLLLPALVLLFRSTNKLAGRLQDLKQMFAGLNMPGRFFLLCGMLFILVVGAWHIIHPDTLGYHAPIITWNEHFKVTPGIANLNGRLGLQSSWFILCALFNFSFTGTTSFTFINSTVLTWLVLFLADKLSGIYHNSETGAKTILIWTVLCFFCFGVNIQAYLTASSASPDFVICIFLWACFYLLLQFTREQQSTTQIIVALFILSFSISLKLSALPALLLLPLIFIQLKGLKRMQRIFLLGFIPALTIFPFMYRSYISTGYPLFPTFYFDFFTPDWKADPTMTRQIDEYVTVYAKLGNVTIEEYAKAANLPFTKWFQNWFVQYTPAEIILTFSAAFAACVHLVFIKYYFEKKNHSFGWIIGVCLVSSIFLMTKAPAPRFSQAFLVPLILAAVYLVTEKFPALQPAKWLQLPLLLLILLPITGYTAYRFYRYFDVVNVWRPYGITTSPLQTLECGGMKIYMPLDPSGCGNAPVPCANNACITFLPRGKKTEDGFKPRNH